LCTFLISFSDEILFHAKLHPQQYSDTFSSAQLKQLHTSIRYVCQTAVDALGDSSKFPEEWLFNHRWGKGKKDAPTNLPNGAKIIHLTVGGRTSCVVPSVQKKTGAVAGEMKETGSDILDTKKFLNGKTVKSKKEKNSSEEKQVKPNGGKDVRKVTSKKRKNDAEVEAEAKEEPNTKGKRRKAAASPTSKKVEDNVDEPFEGRRRSGRISKTKC
jgi:formamidopyrimidine-DNA glycosylase